MLALGLASTRQTWVALAVVVAILGMGLALALLPLPWLLVGLPGLVVVGATLIRPHLALYLVAFAIPFGSLYEVNVGGITIGATEALIGLALASWFARNVALRQAWGTWPRLSLAIALFVGATSLSLLNARSLPFAAKEIIKWVEALAIVAFVANAVPPSAHRHVIVCLLLAGVAQSLLGAYQFFAQSGPEFFVLHGRYMRAYGTFDQPNPYAGYLGLIAPLALALALVLLGRLDPERRRTAAVQGRDWLYWLGLGTFAATSVAIGMSWSRGAWLGLGAAFVAVNLLHSRRGTVLFAIVILGAATAGLVAGSGLLPQPIVQRLTSFVPLVGVSDISAIEITDDNYASLERLAHWQAALDMWRDHPWLGVGFGNYEAAYADYALPKWSLALGHAHNYYLNIAAETGLIGLSAYLALWATALWQAWRAVRRSVSPLGRAVALGALGMLVHVAVHNVVDNLWVHNMYIHVAIVLGLVQAVRLADSRQGETTTGSRHA